jgi:hypothetical protein
MNNYAPPLQGTADNLAKYGRYGDSMLVHMNPIEVQGIASLSPTGRLTTNPVTGQQEAFLPILASLLASAAGASPWLTAAASGAATALQTGDLRKGILSGLTGFGIGKILGAGKDLFTGASEATTGLAQTGEAISGMGFDPASFDITDAASSGIDIGKLSAGQADDYSFYPTRRIEGDGASSDVARSHTPHWCWWR